MRSPFAHHSPRRHSSGRRLLARSAAFIGITLALIIAGSLPSFANGWSGASGAGVGSAGGASYGATMCENINGQNVGVYDGRIIYQAPFPGCSGPRNGPGNRVVGWSQTGIFGVCTAGFEVFRFYGTMANPVETTTISTINLPTPGNDICAAAGGGVTAGGVVDPPVGYSVFSPNPADAGYSLSPYADQLLAGLGYNAFGQTYYVAPGGGFTSGPDVYQSGPSCTSYASKNTAKALQYIVNLITTVPRSLWSPADTRFYNKYMATYNTLSSEFGWAAALAMVDVGAYPDPPCASGYLLTSPSSTPLANQNVFGTCVVPVNMAVGGYVNAAHQVKPTYPAVPGGTYRVQPGVGLPVNYVTPTGVNLGPWLDAWWRNSVGNLVTNPPPGAPVLAQPYNTSLGSQWPGLQPARNPGLAGQTAKAAARCYTGIQAPPFSDTTCVANCTPPTLTLPVHVNTPAYLRVGGKLAPETFTATPGQATCSPKCLSSTVTNLSFTLTLQGTGGYDQCQTSSNLNCDYQIYSETNVGTGQPQSITSGFYNATSSTQAVRVAVNTGPAGGTVTWDKTMSTNGQLSTQKATQSVPITVDVQPPAASLPVLLGTQNPGSFG